MPDLWQKSIHIPVFFAVFGAVGIIDDNASFGIDAGENNEMSTISKISGQHGSDHRGG